MEIKEVFDFLLSAEGWLVLAVVLFALEFFAPGVFFMWLGFAAVVLGGITFIVPDIGTSMQLISFAILGVGFVFVGKTVLKRSPIQSEDNTLNKRGGQYVGRSCEVVEPFKNGRGRVKIEDTIWGATGDGKFKVGDNVKITGVDGTRIQVEALK